MPKVLSKLSHLQQGLFGFSFFHSKTDRKPTYHSIYLYIPRGIKGAGTYRVTKVHQAEQQRAGWSEPEGQGAFLDFGRSVKPLTPGEYSLDSIKNTVLGPNWQYQLCTADLAEYRYS